MTQFHKKKFRIKTSIPSDIAYKENYDDIFMKPCETCNGTGEIHEDRGAEGQWYYRCDDCNGTGKVSKRNG